MAMMIGIILCILFLIVRGGAKFVYVAVLVPILSFTFLVVQHCIIIYFFFVVVACIIMNNK